MTRRNRGIRKQNERKEANEEKNCVGNGTELSRIDWWMGRDVYANEEEKREDEWNKRRDWNRRKKQQDRQSAAVESNMWPTEIRKNCSWRVARETETPIGQETNKPGRLHFTINNLWSSCIKIVSFWSELDKQIRVEIPMHLSSPTICSDEIRSETSRTKMFWGRGYIASKAQRNCTLRSNDYKIERIEHGDWCNSKDISNVKLDNSRRFSRKIECNKMMFLKSCLPNS